MGNIHKIFRDELITLYLHGESLSVVDIFWKKKRLWNSLYEIVLVLNLPSKDDNLLRKAFLLEERFGSTQFFCKNLSFADFTNPQIYSQKWPLYKIGIQEKSTASANSNDVDGSADGSIFFLPSDSFRLSNVRSNRFSKLIGSESRYILNRRLIWEFIANQLGYICLKAFMNHRWLYFSIFVPNSRVKIKKITVTP